MSKAHSLGLLDIEIKTLPCSRKKGIVIVADSTLLITSGSTKGEKNEQGLWHFHDESVSFTGKGHHKHKYPVGHKAHTLRTISGVPLVTLLAPAHESDQAFIFPLLEELHDRYQDLSFSYIILDRGYDAEEIHQNIYEDFEICKDKYCKDHGRNCKCKYCKDYCSKCEDKCDKDDERKCRCKDRYSLTIAGPSGPPSPITLTRVFVSETLPGVTENTFTSNLTAVCLSGALVTGGGFSCPGCGSFSLNIRVNEPLQDLSGWHVVGAYTEGPSATLTFYAICAPGAVAP